jgi:sulfonate transport system permease protein
VTAGRKVTPDATPDRAGAGARGSAGPEHGSPEHGGPERDGSTRFIVRTPQPRDPAARARRRRWAERGLALVLPVLFLCAWQLAAGTRLVDPRFFGSPAAALTSAAEITADGTLPRMIWASLSRVLAGYALGAAAGVLVGLLMGQLRTVRVLLEPTVNALYVVPKIALLPILLLIFKTGELPLILLIAISVFFVVALGSLSAALALPPEFVDVARSMSASRWDVFRMVVLPGSLPAVFGALRLSAGIGVLMLVGAEFVYGDTGLGYLIWHSWSLFRADEMYVGIVTVSVLGVAFTSLIYLIEHWAIPWSHTQKNAGSQ